MDEELYRDFEGLRIFDVYHDESLRSATRYKPLDGDVILATYPKCGSNWTQFIIWNILTRGKQPHGVGELGLLSPFIEVAGAEVAAHPATIGPIVTHLPYSVLKPVDHAKYVYVARNPYDCAVSMYHFVKGLTPATYTDVSFEKFLSLFLTGKVFYGDYFDHVLPWYENRHKSNVLFVTYEQLKADTKGMILKIAHFLGDEHGASLRNNDTLLQRILDNCSIDSMRAFLTDPLLDRLKKIAKVASEKQYKSFKLFENPRQVNVQMHEGAGFVRKGIVGDWKNCFTQEQVERTKKWIAAKTRESDVMSLWHDLCLP
ncbi:sulfotransferase ssu-1-like [Dermacentor andersoni]|uniref:sulfotransferase ssu-1-like n=1 Tax=Dermacentor andersoni TaxID=34620 RepID=UPI002415EC7A|nr:sulfotransferase ssu-1-like [Dermacentor andersoni]XP_054928381.1 sulfotransferase ssu-1-like [Dermacentor andersoni]XP_054928382.1 sulfotransferase ssu-1-like [Dermacentor andersoni]